MVELAQNGEVDCDQNTSILKTNLIVITGGPGAGKTALAVLGLVVGNIGLLIGESGGFLPLRKRIAFSSFLLIMLSLLLAYVPFITHLFYLIKPEAIQLIVLILLGIAVGGIHLGKSVLSS